VYDTLSRIYTGATGQRPPALDAKDAIDDFHAELRFPPKLRDDLHLLRQWRNASEHGIRLCDGSRAPWFEQPQGSSIDPIVFPSRDQIKELVARLNTGWLGTKKESLIAAGEAWA
jgi:hypothetical protein